MRAHIISLAILAITVSWNVQIISAQCANWKGGRAHFPIEGRCDQFKQCSEHGEYVHPCLIGAFMNQGPGICGDTSEKAVANSFCGYCAEGNLAKYPYGDSCDVHYQCNENNNALVPTCCPAGQRFVNNQCQPGSCGLQNYTHPQSCRNYYRCNGDGTLGTPCCGSGRRYNPSIRRCEDDVNNICTEPCLGEKRVVTCPNHSPDPNNACQYFVQTAGTTVTMGCKNRGWDQATCSCSSDVTCAPTPRALGRTECIGYNTSDILQSNDIPEWYFESTTNDRVIGEGNAAVFQAGASLTLNKYSQNMQTYMIRFSVQQTGTGEEVLFSNKCPDNKGTTLSVSSIVVGGTTRRMTVTASLQTSNVPTEVSASLDISQGSFLWISYKQADDTMELALRQGPTGPWSDPVSAPYTGDVTTCAATVGKGLNPAQSLNGRIRDIVVYDKEFCDINELAVTL